MKFQVKNFAMPLVFLGAMLFPIVFGKYISAEICSILYACSLLIQKSLVFFLPVVIFALIFCSIQRSDDGIVSRLLVIIPLVCFSNFINTMLSYFFINVTVGALSVDVVENAEEGLLPYFDVHFGKLVSNDVALLAGVIFGLLARRRLAKCKTSRNELSESGIAKCGLGEKFLNFDVGKSLAEFFDGLIKLFFKILMFVLPVYIIGASIKFQHGGIAQIFDRYFPVLLIFFASSYFWVFVQYFVLAGGVFSKAWTYMKNVLPAVLTAFGSSSSAVAMPISILAAEKNTTQKNIARMIVPATVSIHLVGDCFFIPMLALATMSSFGLELPSIAAYLNFSLHFVLAKFAVAAVPGSGVLVMLPVMQAYLGLNSEMLAFVTAIYVLFDPIITACNVAGNGAFAILFDKVTKKMFCHVGVDKLNRTQNENDDQLGQ